LLSVVPLWLVYEGLRFELAPEERNGAEALVTDGLLLLGPHAHLILRLVLLSLVVVSAIVVARQRLPWLRIAVVSALEGIVYGFLLGPLTQVLTMHVLESGALCLSAPQSVAIGQLDAVELVGSIGAGLFEEAVFRLLLVSGLALALTRAAPAFGMPRALGVIASVVIAALAFSWFHHVGPGGEPFRMPVFVFRLVAGILLGFVFVLRGFAVVVYMHAAYDVHYYLLHD
jgi:hypothetical protein